MKMRKLLAVALVGSVAFAAPARAASDTDDSLGARFKRLFARHTPTPTPTPRKKTIRKKTSATPTPDESPSPGAAESNASASPSATISPSESEAPAAPSPPESGTSAESPAPTNTPAQRESRPGQSQYFEPVRPITPPPTRRGPSRPATAERTTASPGETASEAPSNPNATAAAEKSPGRSATLKASDIADYDIYPVEVRKIIDSALELTGKKLGYKYNSADPAKGGMDSSGFIYYVLAQAGIKDVPRDARDQYVWVRKAGNFQAVLSQKEDTFELDALKPGDLLFWASPPAVNSDPQVTQTMIYLGREKRSNQRLMVGASDGHSYNGQQRSGVGVFEFKVGRVKNAKSDEPGPSFVGYAKIPGLAAD